MKTLWVGGGVCIAAQQQCPADGHNRLATRWNLQILVRNSARNTGRHGSRVDGHQSPAAEPGQIRSTRVRAARDASTSTLPAFAPQPLGTVGNLGWNSIVGPRFWGLDMALSRNFQIREKQSLQFRADAFNITNSFIPAVTPTANPISSAVPAFVNVGNNLFGQILSAQPTRKLQFALKYTF